MIFVIAQSKRVIIEILGLPSDLTAALVAYPTIKKGKPRATIVK